MSRKKIVDADREYATAHGSFLCMCTPQPGVEEVALLGSLARRRRIGRGRAAPIFVASACSPICTGERFSRGSELRCTTLPRRQRVTGGE